jgi:glycerol-3-phosphate dehydrogenase (NAD(P)+)
MNFINQLENLSEQTVFDNLSMNLYHQKNINFYRIFVVGCGNFGTSLANLFAKNFLDFNINAGVCQKELIVFTNSIEKKNEINDFSTNKNCFDNLLLSRNIKATNDINNVFIKNNKNSGIVFIAIPSYALEEFLILNKELIKKYHDFNYLIFCTKGISKNGIFFDDLILKIFGENFINFGFLLGPSFAEEIIMGFETFINLVSHNIKRTNEIIRFFSELQIPKKQIYFIFDNDLKSAQVCSMMKNICAIFIGILRGASKKDDFCAAFFSLFFKEIISLIRAISKEKIINEHNIVFSFAGLADLFLTSTSKKSRNFSFGLEIGELYKDKEKKIHKDNFSNFLSMKKKPEGFFALKNLFYSFIEKQNLGHFFEQKEESMQNNDENFNEKENNFLKFSKKLFDFFDEENNNKFFNFEELFILI